MQIPSRQRLGLRVSGKQDRQAGGRAGRHAGRPTDRKMENNAGDCKRIEWEAGHYLGKKVGAGIGRQTVWVSVWSWVADSGGDLEAGEQEDRQADR